MDTYTFTHTPDPAILRRDLLAAWADRPLPPDFATLCAQTAAEFRALAQDWYDAGDQCRGDRCTAKALGWEIAGATGDLTEARP